MNAYLFGLLLYLIMLCVTSPKDIAHAYGSDEPGPPCNYNWVLQNRCTEQIRIAINYRTCENRVVTQGWWTVQPQGEIMIKMNNPHIGYLAVSQSEKFWWYDQNGPEFGVDLTRDFNYPNDGKRNGVNILKFSWINVTDQHITFLDCQ